MGGFSTEPIEVPRALVAEVRAHIAHTHSLLAAVTVSGCAHFWSGSGLEAHKAVLS